MGRICHAIDAKHRSVNLVYLICNRLYIMYRSKYVTRMRTGDKPRLFGEQRPQILRCKGQAILRSPPFDGQAVGLGSSKPWGDVGFMIDRGDDNFGAWREL